MLCCVVSYCCSLLGIFSLDDRQLDSDTRCNIQRAAGLSVGRCGVDVRKGVTSPVGVCTESGVTRPPTPAFLACHFMYVCLVCVCGDATSPGGGGGGRKRRCLDLLGRDTAQNIPQVCTADHRSYTNCCVHIYVLYLLTLNVSRRDALEGPGRL